MDTWLPKQFFTTDVMILNTTGVSNDSMLTHEVEANVVLSHWLITVHKIGIFSAILLRIIWYSSGAHTIFRYVLQLKPDPVCQTQKSGLRNNTEKTVVFKHA